MMARARHQLQQLRAGVLKLAVHKNRSGPRFGLRLCALGGHGTYALDECTYQPDIVRIG